MTTQDFLVMMERKAFGLYFQKEIREIFQRDVKAGEFAREDPQMVIIGCYWSQAAHSASVNGFYCGYRAAMAVIDKVVPPLSGSFQMTDKLLSMEHHLGYIRSYSEIERQRERRAR